MAAAAPPQLPFDMMSPSTVDLRTLLEDNYKAASQVAGAPGGALFGAVQFGCCCSQRHERRQPACSALV